MNDILHWLSETKQVENVFLTHRKVGGRAENWSYGLYQAVCFVTYTITVVVAVNLTGLLVVCENHKFLPRSDQCRGHFTHPNILTSIAASEILQDILIDINSGKIANYYQELLDFGPLTHRKTKCETAQFQC